MIPEDWSSRPSTASRVSTQSQPSNQGEPSLPAAAQSDLRPLANSRLHRHAAPVHKHKPVEQPLAPSADTNRACHARPPQTTGSTLHLPYIMHASARLAIPIAACTTPPAPRACSAPQDQLHCTASASSNPTLLLLLLLHVAARRCYVASDPQS